MMGNDPNERTESPEEQDSVQQSMAGQDSRPCQCGGCRKPKDPSGCLATPWDLVRRLILLVQNPSDDAAAGWWLSQCSRHAQLVQPKVLKADFRASSLAQDPPVPAPSREVDIDAAREELRRRLAEAEAELSEIDAERARLNEIPGARKDALDDQKEWRKTTDEQLGRGLVQPVDPRPDGDTEYEDIRAAGETKIRHQICTFWEDRSFRDGTRTVACCVLKYIWVLPIAEITLNPRRPLYIGENGPERISRAKYDSLSENDRRGWIFAEPYSVEEHERAHARDYQSKLVAHLAGQAGGRLLQYREFALSAAERDRADERVRRGVRSIVELFCAAYILRDRSRYPHGFSEAGAIIAQREALRRGESEQQSHFLNENAASAADIRWAIDKERRVRRCPHGPEAPTHCLATPPDP